MKLVAYFFIYANLMRSTYWRAAHAVTSFTSIASVTCNYTLIRFLKNSSKHPIHIRFNVTHFIDICAYQSVEIHFVLLLYKDIWLYNKVIPNWNHFMFLGIQKSNTEFVLLLYNILAYKKVIPIEPCRTVGIFFHKNFYYDCLN